MIIDRESKTLGEVKFGEFFELRQNPGVVYVRLDPSRQGSTFISIVVWLDSDQFETQDTYIHAGRAYDHPPTTPVRMLEMKRTPTFKERL